MPTKRIFTARFPTTRIKKIMQLDEDIGKVTATVPPVVSRALELFMEELLTQAYDLTANKNSRTISPSCIKHVIEHNETYGFLRKLVADIPAFKPTQGKHALSTSNGGNDCPVVSESDESVLPSSDDECASTSKNKRNCSSAPKRKNTYKKRKLSEPQLQPVNSQLFCPNAPCTSPLEKSSEATIEPDKPKKKRGRPKKIKALHSNQPDPSVSVQPSRLLPT